MKNIFINNYEKNYFFLALFAFPIPMSSQYCLYLYYGKVEGYKLGNPWSTAS